MTEGLGWSINDDRTEGYLYYEIAAEAGWAIDEKGDPAPCGARLRLFGEALSKAHFGKDLDADAVEAGRAMLAGQLTVDLAHIAAITREKYEAEYDEEGEEGEP